MEIYPLRFKEILRHYGFGQRWIIDAYKHKNLPDHQRVAETWEVCDRPGESSVALNGLYAGKTLHDLINSYPIELLGEDVISRFGNRFPLLIKLLDVTNPLGEQVHHTDQLAEEQNLKDPGKTEAWYMLQTRPGATIQCGQRDDFVDSSMLRSSIINGSIKDCMRPYTVKPDDSFLLYAGSMHYSPGGALFYEIMQNSDVYIGLRKPNDDLSQEEIDWIIKSIHLEKGFECKTTPIQVEMDSHTRTFVLACQYFALERLDIRQSYTLAFPGRNFHVFTVIKGNCRICNNGNREETLHAGQTCLLPAAIENVWIEPLETCSILNAYVPDLEQDIVKPLFQCGFSPAAISRLGGITVLNPLNKLVSGLT